MVGNQPTGQPGRVLAPAAAVLFVLTVIHDLDHLRQGRSLHAELYGVAVVALGSTASVYALARRHHRLAPWAAVVVGAATFVGVAGVHVARHRSFFSDPYPAAHADLVSWAIIVAMIVTGGSWHSSAGGARPAPIHFVHGQPNRIMGARPSNRPRDGAPPARDERSACLERRLSPCGGVPSCCSRS